MLTDHRPRNRGAPNRYQRIIAELSFAEFRRKGLAYGAKNHNQRMHGTLCSTEAKLTADTKSLIANSQQTALMIPKSAVENRFKPAPCALVLCNGAAASWP